MTRRQMNRMGMLLPGWASTWVDRAAAGPVPRVVHTLHGTVVTVDTVSRTLTVRALRLEAWMSAITSIYHVDNPKFLREVKAGDQIMAKVREGETALHHIEIVAVAAPA
jgi:hypothetical protein